MKQTNKRGIRKLSLSSDTVRRLATSDLARAQGGLYITYSYCVDVDENTVPDYTALAVLQWDDEHPNGWSKVATFVRAAPGLYHGAVRNDGVIVARCNHRHTRLDLARTCAEQTLMETP